MKVDRISGVCEYNIHMASGVLEYCRINEGNILPLDSLLQYSITPGRNTVLRRFFVEEIASKGGPCTIRGSEAKHITRVLRMGPGDRLILMDGKGARFQAVIESVRGRDVVVHLEKPLPQPPRPSLVITLCQALLKSQAMDSTVEKTSELGVYRILPFSSERTVVILNEEKFANKKRHWREIAQSAAKQSDRRIPAEIGPLLSFNDLLATLEDEDALKVILWEEEGAVDLKEIIRASQLVKHFIGVVGPEGGFTQEEVQMARGKGFTSASLGQRVLRADTAAITLVAIVQYELGDLSFTHRKIPDTG